MSCLIIAGAAASGAGQTLDRVVASVGNFAITASDVEKEYRFERFLDGQWPAPAPDTAALDAVRHSLAYQALLEREENPGPEDRAAAEKGAAQRLASLHRQFSPQGFATALKGLDLTEGQVLGRLVQQELMLRLIDQSLRPEAAPSDEDVANYYRTTFVPQFQEENGGSAAPELSAVNDQIREVLIQKRINEMLDSWMADLGPSTPPRFHDF